MPSPGASGRGGGAFESSFWSRLPEACSLSELNEVTAAIRLCYGNNWKLLTIKCVTCFLAHGVSNARYSCP